MQTTDKADVTGFYKDHWTDYPLEVRGVLEHLDELFPDGVSGKRVLDGGSGSGRVSVAFSLMGADVTGVDITDKCVENARSLGTECRFLQRDLVELDLGERFDIIYSWGVLHHTRDAKAAFYSLAKHLEPGGEIIIAVYLKTWLSGFWNFSRVFYQKSPGFLKATYRGVGSFFLNLVDVVERIFGSERYMMRGTSNPELINDWFGVPHRTFHSYEEVLEWFRDNGLDGKLINPATGRFKSTSNFVVRGRRPASQHESVAE